MATTEVSSKMKIFLILTAILANAALASAADECDACIDAVCYDKVLQYGTDVIPALNAFTLDRDLNILYFTFEEDGHPHVGAMSLDTELVHIIDFDQHNTTRIFGLTVDPATHDVYMSDSHGVFKFNPNTNQTEFYFTKDGGIKDIKFHKGVLYYSHRPGLYTYSDGKSDSIPVFENIKLFDFIVDKQDNIYYNFGELDMDTSYYNIDVWKKGTDVTSRTAQGLHVPTTDKLGNAYFMEPSDGHLFKLDYDTDKLTKVGIIHGEPYEFVFDNDNGIIYRDVAENKLFKLNINKDKSCAEDAKA